MRLADKVAIVVGAGQMPGQTIGNGRAVSILFAREGARLVLVDRDVESAEETAAMIRAELAGLGREAHVVVVQGDVTNEADCKSYVEAATRAFGRIDILHNNVGVGAGDDSILDLSEASWDRVLNANLKGMFLSCRSALPVMRAQGAGAIVNVSSIAAVCSSGMVAYTASKAGLNALTHQIASENAQYGIRANVVMPGLMDTPMAIEGISKSRGIPRDELIRARESRVPLGKKMGTAWDVAYAALFLASDEARFITGAVLPVDGGQSARIG